MINLHKRMLLDPVGIKPATSLATEAGKDDHVHVHPINLITLCCAHIESLDPWISKEPQANTDQTAVISRLGPFVQNKRCG